MSQLKSNLVFIDSNLRDTDVLLSSLNDETVGIVYHYDTSRNDILEQIKQRFSSITRVAIACHEGERRFLEGQDFFDVSYNPHDSGAEPDDLEPEFITEYSGLIQNANTQFILDLLTTYNVSNIDYLACKSLKYQMWKDYYALIESQVQSVTVGASEDDTGNLKYGGDWVLENTGEQVDSIYFGEGLEYYKHLLNTNFIVNLFENVAEFNLNPPHFIEGIQEAKLTIKLPYRVTGSSKYKTSSSLTHNNVSTDDLSQNFMNDLNNAITIDPSYIVDLSGELQYVRREQKGYLDVFEVTLLKKNQINKLDNIIKLFGTFNGESCDVSLMFHVNEYATAASLYPFAQNASITGTKLQLAEFQIYDHSGNLFTISNTDNTNFKVYAFK